MKPHLMTSARSRYELYTPKQKMELYKQSIGLGKQKNREWENMKFLQKNLWLAKVILLKEMEKK